MFEIFQDSIMQSFIFSPLMGVIFAAVFTGFTSSPSMYTPSTVIETQKIFIDRRTQYISGKSNTDDGGGLIALGVGVLFLVFFYVKNVTIIHHYIGFGLVTMFSFCITCLLVSFVKGHFTSGEWFAKVLIPILTLASCFVLLAFAKAGISSELIETANSSNLWQFFTKEITKYGRYYLILHAFGVGCLVLLTLLSTAAFIHYLALMNQREYGCFHSFWVRLAMITNRFSADNTGVYLVIGVSVAGLLLSGQLASWIVGR